MCVYVGVMREGEGEGQDWEPFLCCIRTEEQTRRSAQRGRRSAPGNLVALDCASNSGLAGAGGSRWLAAGAGPCDSPISS